MLAQFRSILVLLSVTATFPQAQAQTQGAAANAFPVEPDVVFVCYRDNQPAAACHFACGTLGPAQPSPMPGVYEKVSRIEFYSHGYPGRVDQRTWIAIQRDSPLDFQTSYSSVTYQYLPQNAFCSVDSLIVAGQKNDPVRIEFRLVKFNQ